MNSNKEWLDPLFLEDFLNEEEKSIKNNTNKFCKEVLLPNVVEHNRNHFFDNSDLKIAGNISKMFFNIKKKIKNNKNINKFLLEIKKEMQKKFKIKIEYLELRNEKNLQISNKSIGSKIFVSYYLNGIRLIDNF